MNAVVGQACAARSKSDQREDNSDFFELRLAEGWSVNRRKLSRCFRVGNLPRWCSGRDYKRRPWLLDIQKFFSLVGPPTKLNRPLLSLRHRGRENRSIFEHPVISALTWLRFGSVLNQVRLLIPRRDIHEADSESSSCGIVNDLCGVNCFFGRQPHSDLLTGSLQIDCIENSCGPPNFLVLCQCGP